jgi:AraC family transcriptional regulator, regulatory protein of adaptative response / DNA-3-methyladenine glycosylase II
MLIPLPQPFDAPSLLGFLRTRQASAIERIEANRIRRAVQVSGSVGVLDVTIGPDCIDAKCSAPSSTESLRAMVARMLDLDADVDAFARQVGGDRVLGRLVRARPGLRVPQFLDPFECVVRALLGQQVTVRAATTLMNRVAIGFASPEMDVGGTGLQVGPSAAQLAAAGPDRLRSFGIMPSRAAALHSIATAIAEGRVDLEALRTVPGEEAQAALDALPGIGPWTAAYIRMRALGDRDAFPAADLGVLKALRATAAEAERRSRRWSPWRAYATMHLWAGLAEGSGDDHAAAGFDTS